MKNAFNFALLMFFAAFAGTALRQFENEHFYAFGLAVLGMFAVATVAGIRFRNWLDRRAIQN